ncbi:hypothetical protein BRC66_02650 [Halobacteriales archaeon QH_2_66_30]|nr:MAG: hypothetical protein BRC66_02650 [Halobacteriales archaeon QH_2_66_30]
MSAPSRFRRLVPDTRLTGEGQLTRPWLLYLSIPVALVNRAIPRRVLAWLVERLGLGPLLGTVLSGLSGFVVGVLVVIGLFAAVDVVAGDRLPTGAEAGNVVENANAD